MNPGNLLKWRLGTWLAPAVLGLALVAAGCDEWG
jgi:hypothetical protein